MVSNMQILLSGNCQFLGGRGGGGLSLLYGCFQVLNIWRWKLEGGSHNISLLKIDLWCLMCNQNNHWNMGFLLQGALAQVGGALAQLDGCLSSIPGWRGRVVTLKVPYGVRWEWRFVSQSSSLQSLTCLNNNKWSVRFLDENNIGDRGPL